MQSTSATVAQKYADLVLGQPVVEFLATKRAEGLSLRKTVAALREATAGEVDITEQTARMWLRGREVAA